MHALTLASLKYIKEITMTASTQSFSRCRTRMIRILLSEKASQTLNSIMLKCVVCTDKLKLLILSHVRLLHLCNLFMDCYSSILLYLFVFEVYVQHVWTLNFESSSAKFTQKLVYPYTITPFRGANWALSAGVTNIWPLKNSTIWCYSKSSGAKHAQEAGVVLHHSSVALAPF